MPFGRFSFYGLYIANVSEMIAGLSIVLAHNNSIASKRLQCSKALPSASSLFGHNDTPRISSTA